MPCNSEHMSRTAREAESVNIQTLLHEVGLRSRRPDYYGAPESLDRDTAELCSWCRENDVQEQSLELQIWWRDHQKHDAKREAEEAKKKAKRKKALAKLTKEERKLLGL